MQGADLHSHCQFLPIEGAFVARTLVQNEIQYSKILSPKCPVLDIKISLRVMLFRFKTRTTRYKEIFPYKTRRTVQSTDCFDLAHIFCKSLLAHHLFFHPALPVFFITLAHIAMLHHKIFHLFYLRII